MYPIILCVRDRPALVVGGGKVAERKLRGLLDAGAKVTLVSPAVTAEIGRLAQAGSLHWIARPFAAGDADRVFIAIAATGDPRVNAAVVAAARAAGALVNDAGDAANGDFTTPAIHRSGALTVSVDSAGLAPGFTKRIRDELAVVFDTRYARAAATLGRLRERVQAVVPLPGRAAVMKHFSERDIDDLAGMPASEMEHEVERAADTVANVVPAEPHTLVCASRASALGDGSNAHDDGAARGRRHRFDRSEHHDPRRCRPGPRAGRHRRRQLVRQRTRECAARPARRLRRALVQGSRPAFCPRT